MATINKELKSKIQSLPDAAKLELVDSILAELDRPDPEIDGVWAEEARHRWQAYKAGKTGTVSYERVMSKHRNR